MGGRTTEEALKRLDGTERHEATPHQRFWFSYCAGSRPWAEPFFCLHAQLRGAPAMSAAIGQQQTGIRRARKYLIPKSSYIGPLNSGCLSGRTSCLG